MYDDGQQVQTVPRCVHSQERQEEPGDGAQGPDQRGGTAAVPAEDPGLRPVRQSERNAETGRAGQGAGPEGGGGGRAAGGRQAQERHIHRERETHLGKAAGPGWQATTSWMPCSPADTGLGVNGKASTDRLLEFAECFQGRQKSGPASGNARSFIFVPKISL